MKKNTTTPKVEKKTVADFVQSIDAELNQRESALLTLKSELETMRDSVAHDRLEVEESKVALDKEKADFSVLSSGVDQKFAKIRQDEELSEAFGAQALERKSLDKLAKQAEEDRKLSEINLQELQKRELKLSEREKNYKEEIKKEFASNIFKA